MSSMTDKEAPKLSPERERELRARHPLYSRVAGEVVWVLCEELGYDAEACGEMLDAFVAERQQITALMNEWEQSPPPALRLDFRAEACPLRQTLADKSIRPGKDWAQFLPPFAVGCGVSLRPVYEGAEYVEAEAQAQPPACPLLCPLLEEALPASS